MHLTIKQNGNEVKPKVLDGPILSLLIMKNPDTVFIAQDRVDETPGPINLDVLMTTSINLDKMNPMQALLILVEEGKMSWNDAVRLVSRIESSEEKVKYV